MNTMHNSSPSTLESCFAPIDGPIRAILELCLEGRELGWQDAERLCHVNGPELLALCVTADHLRREQVGDTVTYVINRNINFTNACVKACKFCAFARNHRSEETYFLDREEIIRRARAARDLGATEVCMQAGLAPGMNGREYIDLCRAVKTALPDLDIHAFSPEEVKYGAGLSGMPIRAYLEELKDAGLGSLPGTSAEVLDDSVRARIAPGRITTAEWIDVIRTAHEIGLPTTSTLMFGHIETAADCVRHLSLLRSIQAETGGFTEFVPLSFVHTEAPMYLKGLLPGLRPGPTGNEVVRLFAVSRLMLGQAIPNLQASWVKEGIRQAQWLLSSGANDIGGTLMNESISTAAGAAHGQFMSPAMLRRAIRDAGRTPAQRNTRYQVLRAYPLQPEDGEDETAPLDRVADADETFGTYTALTHDGRFRFLRKRDRAATASSS